MGDLGECGDLRRILRRVASKITFKWDYFNNEGLPDRLASFDPLVKPLSSAFGISGLHKYLHYRSWFQRELASYLVNVLADVQARRSPFWSIGMLESMAREHIRGHKNYVREINAVLSLEAVERLMFRDLPFGLPNSKKLTHEVVQKESVQIV
jgi:asparagine synthase (glutamine-hydrolysing)